jgi:5-methylcytosine-specific restriction enzyme A
MRRIHRRRDGEPLVAAGCSQLIATAPPGRPLPLPIATAHRGSTPKNMPALAKRYCSQPGSRCSDFATKDGRCTAHQRKDSDTRSHQAQAWHKLYGARWQRYRLVFLADHPLCVECEGQGAIEPATVVDHITPHRGDVALFWDGANHQPMCTACHNRKTATEDGGFGNEGPAGSHRVGGIAMSEAPAPQTGGPSFFRACKMENKSGPA